MAEEVKIEKLERQDLPEVLDLFAQAFEDNPTVPGISIGSTRKLMKASLDFFGGTKSSSLCGIRKNGKLVCVSLSLDSKAQHSIFAWIRLILALLWTIGWRSAIKLAVVPREQPKYKSHYLCLSVLGTLPAYHGQGFGRKMLHFLCKKAIDEKYKGIILFTKKGAPSFNLYIKEGYVVDREFKAFKAQDQILCWMRLELITNG